MHDPVLETDTGLAINVLRILLRMTQKDLAKAIGIGTSSISDWETGKVIPRDASVDRVLSGMKLTPSALDRTLHYIHEMRAELLGDEYPMPVTPSDEVREPGPRPAIQNQSTRLEVDAMARVVADLARRFLENHFSALEQVATSQSQPSESPPATP